MANTIYLDNQAATPIDPAVLAVIHEAMATEFANPSSENHRLGWGARTAVETARAAIAACIGADPEELLFTSGATEANNLGVLGAALGAPLARRRILVGATEHKAVLESAAAAKDYGFSVETIPVDRNGLIDPAHFHALLGPDVAVVSIMAVNNEIGTIQDVATLAQLAAEAGAFVHCDATQAVAAVDIDVTAWAIDAASFSSHKIYGPKGIGALYLASVAPWRPKPLMFGGGQEAGLRPGTIPTPLCIGFAEAMRIIVQRSAAERDAIAGLRDRLAAGLRAAVPDMVETARTVSRHPGNLHVRFPGVNADDLLNRLQPDLAASTGSACVSGRLSGSHVMLAIGTSNEQASEGIRLSLGRFTTEGDIDRAISLVREAIVQIG